MVVEKTSSWEDEGGAGFGGGSMELKVEIVAIVEGDENFQ